VFLDLDQEMEQEVEGVSTMKTKSNEQKVKEPKMKTLRLKMFYLEVE
jgi:hypothetical protein